MLAHLTPLLLLLANPIAGGDAAEPGRPALEREAPALLRETQAAQLLRDEFEVLREGHTRAKSGLALTPGAAQTADQAYRARFIELSRRGSGRATAWFLRAFPLDTRATRDELTARLGLYEGLARDSADRAWLLDPAFDLFRVLERDAALLGRGPAIEIAEAFARASTADETRAAALGSAALLEARWTDADPKRRARARQRHQDLITRFPATAQANASRDAMWRLSNLVVGKAPPEFITRDVDGNEIRLAELHRRVLVVEFWSDSTPGIREWADQLRALVERHLSERLFVLGVNLDADPLRFRRALEKLSVEWPNAFDGGLSSRQTWRLDQPGTNLVLDASGILRFVDIHGAELDAAVAELLAETRAPAGSALQSQSQAGATKGL